MANRFERAVSIIFEKRAVDILRGRATLTPTLRKLTPESSIHLTNYRGWPNSYRLTNGEIEVIVTSDIGPRVMHYGFVDGQNLFYECAGQFGGTSEPWWLIRGGHRLWVAPETVPETYALDNCPVSVALAGTDTIALTAPVEPETKLQKRMILTLDQRGGVHLEHQIANCGTHPVRWAIWALTALAAGGTAFAAFPERGSHEQQLLPTHPLVMWAYTDLSDPRWNFTKKYLILRQDSALPNAQKAGFFNPDTFSAYLLGPDLFVKRSQADPNLPYTDFHCSFETFTNPDFLELETLGPLVALAPGQTAKHVEHWSLHRGISIPEWTDPELDRVRSLVS